MMFVYIDPTDLDDTIRGALLLDKKLLFFPVNNNTSVTKTGGSHWSLLVWDSEHQKFYLFDSFGTTNYTPARRLADKLVSYLMMSEDQTKPGKREAKTSASVPPERKILSQEDFVIFRCPQQVSPFIFQISYPVFSNVKPPPPHVFSLALSLIHTHSFDYKCVYVTNVANVV